MNHSEDFNNTNFGNGTVDRLEIPDLIRTALTIGAVFSAISTIISIYLLSTCLFKQLRAVSAAWYIYFLLAVCSIYGLIMCIGMSNPFLYLSRNCILHTFDQMMQLLYSGAVFWINIEVFRTIISPKVSWINTRFRRFCIAIGVTCGICLLLAIVAGLLSTIIGCFNVVIEASMHILKNWIPGVAIIIMSILNVVYYIKLRSRGLASYKQVVDDTVEIRPTEWFICLMLINAIFIVFEIAFLHMGMFTYSSDHIRVFIRVIERLMLICLGYPILALHVVRQAIVAFWRAKCKCGGTETQDGERYDVDMEPIADDSL